MCLEAKDYKVYRATSPIAVFKRGFRPAGASHITPTFRNFQYCFGKMYGSSLQSEDRWTPRNIGPGLHSWAHNKREWEHSRSNTFHAIIPEGAFFVVGKRGDIASTHLIVYSRQQRRPKARPLDVSKHKVVKGFRGKQLNIPYVAPTR